MKDSIRDSGRGETNQVQESGSIKAHSDTLHTNVVLPEPVTNGVAHPLMNESGYSLSSISLQKEKTPQCNISASPLNGFGSIKDSQRTASASAKGRLNGLPPTDDASSPSSLQENDFDALACELSNRAITCPHGKLDPEETRNTRVVSSVGDWCWVISIL